jgi:alkylation response protein AidB-like acyl-CoA dehydrogenase
MREDSRLPALDHQEIRAAVRELFAHFPPEYFREIDAQRAYPESFVAALTNAGWLAALIPEDYGGGGLTLTEASIIMEEINRSGGNSGACHGHMYNMGTLLRHGSEEQKRACLPRIATGDLRLQSMAVTEPTAGTDTTVDEPRGDPGNTLTRDELEEKALRLANFSSAATPAEMEIVFARIRELTRTPKIGCFLA